MVLELHNGLLDHHFLPLKYAHRFELTQLGSSPFILLTFQPGPLTEIGEKARSPSCTSSQLHPAEEARAWRFCLAEQKST